MGKKITVIFFICILTGIMVFSYLFVSRQSIHKINSVNIANYDDGYIYGIDMDSDKYYIFRVNIDSGKQEFFTYPIERNGSEVILNDLSWSDDGNLYVHLREKKSPETEAVDTIECCNFNLGRLITAWNVSDLIEDEYFFFNSNINGGMGLVTINDESRTLRQYKLNDKGTAEEINSIKLHELAYMIIVDDNGKFWTMSINGDIGMVENDGSIRTVFLNDGSQIGTENVNHEFSEDGIHFLNLDTGYNCKITKETNYEKVEMCFEHKIAYAKSFKVSDMYNMYENNGVYVGVLSLDDGRNVPALCGEKEYILDQLSWTRGKVIAVTLLMFLCVSLVLVIYVYAFYRMWKRKGGAPVFGIATMLILPIIAVGIMGLFHFIDSRWSNEKEEKIQQLYVINEIIKNKIDIEMLEAYREKDQLNYKELENLQFGLNDNEEVKNIDDGNSEYINDTILANLYFYKNNDIYSAVTWYQLGIPMSYQITSNAYECMKESAEMDKAVSVEYNDLTGRYISVFSPIKNAKDDAIGVLEVNESTTVLELDILNSTRMIKNLVLAAAAMLFILIQAVLWINTRPLKGLRQAMTDVAKGNLSARANIRGNHEIAVIGGEFDKMAELIENRVCEVEEFQKKYEAFVPSKFFYILKRNGIREAAAGDSGIFTATVMAVNSSGYKDAVIRKYDEVFLYSNKYLPKEIPIIHSYGGIIRRIFEGGEETIFINETQNKAAECAIDVIESVKDSGEKFCAGIAKEELRFGVIGLPKRMAMAMISEHGSLSWFLQQMAAKFNANILITGNAADEIENFFERYDIRKIGYLYMTSTKRMEIIYEILNGGNLERNRVKLKTKTEFEEGIRLFMEKSYGYARKRFINVLKNDVYDGAAKEYVLLCDMSLSGKKAEPWLDKY